MKNLQQKLDQLKWLKSVGIEYYCSDQKDSKISLISELKKISLDNKQSNLITPQINIKESENQMPKAISKIKKTAKKKIDSVPNHAEIEARKLADAASNLSGLKIAVENFTHCDLKKFASNTVFSDGQETAKILLLGEAPGASEDESGVPFCGESGILLDKMLASIGISREKNIYITNSVFWRPPANRRPTTDEINICKPFVEKHIALIKPELIILVGGTAITSMLGKVESVSDIRQNYHLYNNQYLSKPIHTTALFHPAYLLRQPSKKKDTWYDLLKIEDFINTQTEKNL